jgi:hypothetical protein
MRAKLAVLSALCALGSATYAHATSGSITYFGVVNATQTLNGHVESAPELDAAGLFGGGSLEGDHINATFLYDTANGTETLTPGMSDEVDGGSGNGGGLPITSVTFTVEVPFFIKGDPVPQYHDYSYSFAPDYYADLLTSTSGVQDTAYNEAGDSIQAYLVSDFAAPISFSQSFASSGYGPESFFNTAIGKDGTYDTIVFDTISVTVDAAPEPSTWMLSVLGVGVLGCALRLGRSHRQVIA